MTDFSHALALPPFPWPPESALNAYSAERAEAIRQAIAELKMVVFDFDGVFTDNAVWVTQEGVELVRASRFEGFGLVRLQKRGIELMVLSTEVNPVVSARCDKLKLDRKQGVHDKLPALCEIVEGKGLTLAQVGYLGNDTNDIQCLQNVGFPMTVGDAHPAVIDLGLYRTVRPGGYGAVREVCDLIDKLKG